MNIFDFVHCIWLSRQLYACPSTGNRKKPVQSNEAERDLEQEKSELQNDLPPQEYPIWPRNPEPPDRSAADPAGDWSAVLRHRNRQPRFRRLRFPPPGGWQGTSRPASRSLSMPSLSASTARREALSSPFALDAS